MNYINSFFAFLGRKSKPKNIQLNTPLHVVARGMFRNIGNCSEYNQLASCEEYFQNILTKYSGDNSIEYFKTIVRNAIETQSVQIQKSKKHASNIA